MERKVEGNQVAYQGAATVYVITALNPVAGLLETSLIHTSSEELDFLYEDTGIQKLITAIPEEAVDHKAAARKLGFKQEGRLKRATPTGDLLMFGQYR